MIVVVPVKPEVIFPVLYGLRETDVLLDPRSHGIENPGQPSRIDRHGSAAEAMKTAFTVGSQQFLLSMRPVIQFPVRAKQCPQFFRHFHRSYAFFLSEPGDQFRQFS